MSTQPRICRDCGVRPCLKRRMVCAICQVAKVEAKKKDTSLPEDMPTRTERKHIRASDLRWAKLLATEGEDALKHFRD